MINDRQELIFYIPSIERGGVEKNLFELLSLLTKDKKFKLKLVTYEKPKNFQHKNIKIITSIKLGIKNRPLKYIVCFFLLFFQINSKKQIVVSYQNNIFAILVSMIRGCKVLIRCNTSLKKYINNKLTKTFYRFLYSKADKIIVNSKDFKKEFKKILNLNAYLIYNALNIKKIKSLSRVKYRNNFFDKNHLNLISVGRLVPQKDQITLLKAVNYAKDKTKIKLLIMGSGAERNFLNNYIYTKGLRKIVKILDFSKNPYPQVKNADALVLSSLFEGFPNVLIEAQILKTLIIASNCPTGPREIIEKNLRGIIFKKGDYLNLGKLLINVNKESKINKKRVLNGYNYAKKFEHKKHYNSFKKLVYFL